MLSPNSGFPPADNLPSQKTIVALCRAAGYECTGIPLYSKPSGPIIAWVRYGPNVTMPAAFTQDWVAKYLEANPAGGVLVPRVFMASTDDNPNCTIGYIVMQYIDAVVCDTGDVELVAAAVQTLISVPAPSDAPGPVGGGPIIHNFFVDWTSAITYESVEELQQHINGVISALIF